MWWLANLSKFRNQFELLFVGSFKLLNLSEIPARSESGKCCARIRNSSISDPHCSHQSVRSKPPTPSKAKKMNIKNSFAGIVFHIAWETNSWGTRTWINCCPRTRSTETLQCQLALHSYQKWLKRITLRSWGTFLAKHFIKLSVCADFTRKSTDFQTSRVVVPDPTGSLWFFWIQQT